MRAHVLAAVAALALLDSPATAVPTASLESQIETVPGPCAAASTDCTVSALLAPMLWPDAAFGTGRTTAMPVAVSEPLIAAILHPDREPNLKPFEDPSALPKPAAFTLQTTVSAKGSEESRTAIPPATPLSLPRTLPEFKLNADRVSHDKPSLAPMAFVRFCMRYPAECAVHDDQSATVPVVLTRERKAELDAVNRAVNRAIRPQENTGGVMAEEWLISPPAGDCNDYAVTKRHRLRALGWPSHALLLAEVALLSGEHHLVLVVRTDEGDFVLDNLNWNVRSVSRTTYHWVRAQQSSNPTFWSSISITRAVRVAMNAR